MKINFKEKILVVATVVLLIAIGVKSVYFDPMTPQGETETALYNQMAKVIEDKYTSVLYTSHFMSTRIIEIKEEEGYLKGHYRKYVLSVFPFGDEYYDEADE